MLIEDKQFECDLHLNKLIIYSVKLDETIVEDEEFEFHRNFHLFSLSIRIFENDIDSLIVLRDVFNRFVFLKFLERINIF